MNYFCQRRGERETCSEGEFSCTFSEKDIKYERGKYVIRQEYQNGKNKIKLTCPLFRISLEAVLKLGGKC